METPSLARLDLDSLEPFEARVGVRLLFGRGHLKQLAEEVTHLNCRRPLVVSDPGLEQAGHVDRVKHILRGGGLDCLTFTEVEPNPTTECVDRGVEVARGHDADGIVGLGGGSSMDCAKGINFLLTNGGRMADYWGSGKARKIMLPSVGVPTTVGTGSEAQSYALISDAETRVKMACGDPKARFRTVILDPDLLSTLPRSVLSVTAMDAVSHVVESYVCTRASIVSRMFAAQAWTLVCSSFNAAFDRSDSGLERMLLGAHLAGHSIEASMLGAAHACSNPLTARFGITHGTAVGLMLPHVVRLNADVCEPLYGQLAAIAGVHESSEGLARYLNEMQRLGGLPTRLAELGVGEDSFEWLAGEAVRQWTAQFNPRSLGTDECVRLYQQAA